jgi:hypothetical protein
MTMSGGPRPTIEALAVGRPQRIGRYEYRVRGDSWWWSDTFYGILGFQTGQVVPSASVMAAHFRPEGMDRGVEAVEAAFMTGEPFSFHTRIVDGHGSDRTVLLTGHGEALDDGRVELVKGYLIDLTEARRLASQSDVQDALNGALEHRAVIEQAKGVLMLAHGVDADEAFDLLRVYSQDKNIKVRDLADRLVELVAKDADPDKGFLRKVLQILDAVG